MIGARAGHGFVALLLAVAAMLLLTPDAFAIADDISLGAFSCSGGKATGQLILTNASCPTTLTKDNLFSFLVCNMEQLSSNLMGHMFCGMVAELTPAVWAVVTLAVLFFGISFTIGLTPATGQEAMLFALKIGLITAFATNADYLIGYGYRFLIGAIHDGTSIAITVINKNSGNLISNGGDVYGELDKFLGTFFKYATDMVGAKDPKGFCKNGLFAVLATMFVILPLLAYVGILLIARIVISFFRAVFAYIYAIVGITFLLLLAPFFIPFALFKITKTLFDRWIAYLASFALQVVLLFTFLAFIFSMDITKNSVVSNLTDIVMYNSEAAETTSYRLSFAYCTLCDFKVVDKNDASKEITDKDPNYITDGKLQCKDSPAKPIRPSFGIAPDTKADPTSKSQFGALLKLLGNGFLSLIILAILVEHLLKLIPSLAQKMAAGLGATYSTQLGGGFSASSVPTTSIPGEFLAKDFSAGFERGFQSQNNGASATIQGIKDGFSGMVTGRTSSGQRLDGSARADDDKDNPNLSGSQNAFKRWFSDPTTFGY